MLFRSAASSGSSSAAARRQRLCAGLAAGAEPARWRRQRPPGSRAGRAEQSWCRTMLTDSVCRGSVGWDHITGLCKIRRKIRLVGFIVVFARRYGRRYERRYRRYGEDRGYGSYCLHVREYAARGHECTRRRDNTTGMRSTHVATYSFDPPLGEVLSLFLVLGI